MMHTLKRRLEIIVVHTRGLVPLPSQVRAEVLPRSTNLDHDLSALRVVVVSWG